MKTTTTKQIFIIDDHPVFREGLAALVKREAGLSVCGEVGDAQAGLAGVQRLNPDLVLVDVGLPGKSGLELIKDLRALFPELPILVISMYDEAIYAERVLRAGARGFIMKQEGPDAILRAIKQVATGQIFLSGRMSLRILDAFSTPRSHASSGISCLTDRELEVLRLLGGGRDTHAIARQLHLSSKTVDAHRGRIKEKLALNNVTELICYAARWVETQGAASRVE